MHLLACLKLMLFKVDKGIKIFPQTGKVNERASGDVGKYLNSQGYNTDTGDHFYCST